jgi:cytochrome c oxidase subunit 3
MQGFNQGNSVISLGLIITVFGMGLWFRDIVIEGTAFQFKPYLKFFF